MVLKSLHILVLMGVLFTGAPEGRLLSQYKSKVQKKLTKVYETSGQPTLKPLESKQPSLELYQINHQLSTIGYLALREVKACSLNGCTSQGSKIQHLASEYYDIAVFIDLALTINQIIILDYFSDYGYEISSKRYLNQYQGKYLPDFSPKTPLVDGVSGATISYDALIVSLEEIGKLIPKEIELNRE